MTKYVEPQGAQLGDAVLDICGSGKLDGTVVGIDTQAPGILVRWIEAGPMDVYSLDSPVWSCFAIVRYGAPKPVSDPYAVEGIGLQQACTACHNVTERDGSCQHPAPIEPALDVPTLTLPWSNPDGA